MAERPNASALKAEGFTPRGFKSLSFRQRCSWAFTEVHQRTNVGALSRHFVAWTSTGVVASRSQGCSQLLPFWGALLPVLEGFEPWRVAAFLATEHRDRLVDHHPVQILANEYSLLMRTAARSVLLVPCSAPDPTPHAVASLLRRGGGCSYRIVGCRGNLADTVTRTPLQPLRRSRPSEQSAAAARRLAYAPRRLRPARHSRRHARFIHFPPHLRGSGRCRSPRSDRRNSSTW
jgi:hypothetical protein